MLNVPGIKAKHAIIKPTCRILHGDVNAFDIAVQRMREEYLILLNCSPQNKDASYHLVLTVEREK